MQCLLNWPRLIYYTAVGVLNVNPINWEKITRCSLLNYFIVLTRINLYLIHTVKTTQLYLVSVLLHLYVSGHLLEKLCIFVLFIYFCSLHNFKQGPWVQPAPGPRKPQLRPCTLINVTQLIQYYVIFCHNPNIRSIREERDETNDTGYAGVSPGWLWH